jgi:single-strand DNA-binding protein
MNSATFAGYIGKDAALRQTQNNNTVANFSLGVTVGYGEQQHTLWIACALYGERASKLAPYLLKGTPIAVSGDVDLRTYQTQDGRSGAELTLTVQRVTLLGKKRDNEDRPAAKAAPAKQAAPAGGDDFDDDIPF